MQINFEQNANACIDGGHGYRRSGLLKKLSRVSDIAYPVLGGYFKRWDYQQLLHGLLESMKLKDRTKKIDWDLILDDNTDGEDFFAEVFTSRWAFRAAILLGIIGIVKSWKIFLCIPSVFIIPALGPYDACTGGSGSHPVVLSLLLLFLGIVILIIHIKALEDYDNTNPFLLPMISWLKDNLDEESKVSLSRHIVADISMRVIEGLRESDIEESGGADELLEKFKAGGRFDKRVERILELFIDNEEEE